MENVGNFGEFADDKNMRASVGDPAGDAHAINTGLIQGVLTQFNASAGVLINEREDASLVLNTNVIPPTLDPQDEYESIFEEFVLGSAIRERAFYRIWRLRNTGDWMRIVGINGDLYRTWEDFIRDISSNDALGIGRQIIFDRMKAYDQLLWLGNSHEDIVLKMSAKPSLYTRVLKRLMNWDSASKAPTSIMIPGIDVNDTDSSKNALNEVITNAESFNRQIDAIKYVDENILMAPRISIYMEDDTIVVDYIKTSVDENGEIHVDEDGQVRFYANQSIPDWVLSVIQINVGTK